MPEPSEHHIVTLRAPRAGDFGWVVEQHGRIYSDEYGWNLQFEGLVAGIVAEYIGHHDPSREAGWIAEVDGERAGSIFCVASDAETAKLRLLFVDRTARGMGVGSRLVEQCVTFAREAGYSRMVLWTVDLLDSARRLYEAVGFRLVNEEPYHGFGHDLVSQDWELDLDPGKVSSNIDI